MALSERFRWRLPKCCVYALIFTAGLGVGFFVDSVRQAVGCMEYYSRRGSLMNLQVALLNQAKKEGRFPPTIEPLINEWGLSNVVRAADLTYWASDMGYDSISSTTLLFCEKEPRQYGFTRGAFWFERDHWEFQLTW